jgi:hypothetical protein
MRQTARAVQGQGRSAESAGPYHVSLKKLLIAPHLSRKENSRVRIGVTAWRRNRAPREIRKAVHMDIVAWLGWALLTVLGVLWSIIWFLISGWVSTLLQVALLVAVIYFLKYGWQRAPAEILRRTRTFGRFFWSWLRAREPQTSAGSDVREVVRVVTAKEFGDINISTLLSLVMLAGLALLTRL